MDDSLSQPEKEGKPSMPRNRSGQARETPSRSRSRPPSLTRTILASLPLSVMILPLAELPNAEAQESTEVVEGTIEAGVDRAADGEIEERLRATFSALDELAGVAVEVEAGVVALTGEVDTARSQQLAGDLAAKVGGVTAVENAIVETRSIRRRLRFAFERLADRTFELVDRLPLLLVAFAVFLASVALSRLIVRIEAPFAWLTENVFLQDLARQAARFGVIVCGALGALEILDATALVGAVLGAAGVFGLAVGFAFRDLVENYVASVLLSLRQPFVPRDHVKIDGYEGYVGRLTSRATILITFDGNHVRIPNATVFKTAIENFTRNPGRRFDFVVGVGAGEDLVSAQELGTDVLRCMTGVLDEPAPFALVEALGDSSVTLRFFGWVDQRHTDFGKVRSEAIRLVKQAFDRRAIEMPEPIQRIHIDSMPQDAARRDSAAIDEADLSPPEPETRAVADARRAPPTDEVVDISIDRHLEELVDEERSGAGGDLLRETAPTE